MRYQNKVILSHVVLGLLTMNTFVLICGVISLSSVDSILVLGDNKQVAWTVTNYNGSISIPATVPGGIYSDLQTAGVIGDILAGFNDVLTRWVAYDSWLYTARFNVSENDLKASIAHLILAGVDTVAFIELNESPIGKANNMFVRYVFDVRSHLKVGQNVLKIQFASPVTVATRRSKDFFTAPQCVPDGYNGECHANQLRKMQASFGWDWGPAFPSVGIWRAIYIDFYDGVNIRTISTQIVNVDSHWNIRIRAHLESSFVKRQLKGYLSASLKGDSDQLILVGKDVEINTRDDGTAEVDIDMSISENSVSLWWPNGYGEQPLYNLHVYLSTKGDPATAKRTIRIGFRTVKVVENNASLIFGNTTAGQGLTFYFEINGYPLFMKGSNWIPSDILPENGTTTETIENLLNSAKDAHMSMLRVWGGGVYESDYFYSRCDELGIMIWQDFMFACSMYPSDQEFLDSVRTEVEQNVVRLQYHPSIAVWAGNNENEVALRGNWYNTAHEFKRYKDEYIKLYVDTIKPIVETLDPGRRYVVSSPSNGKKSEQDGYIAINPYDSHYGDTHYYNYLADNWDQNIYPPTRFASEYGVQSLPTLKTMKTATQDEKDFHVNSSYSKHRQHSPFGYMHLQVQIAKRLKLNDSDPKHFEKFVFYSQISQAMAIKAETEYYRQSQADWYTMGALYWQLNDVWQAPSWSSIEYTGNWKMLHYFACNFFAPVLVSPRLLTSGIVHVYLLNDQFVSIVNGRITIDVYNWTSMVPIETTSYEANAKALGSTKQDIELDLWTKYKETEVFLKFSLIADGVSYSPDNYVFPKPFTAIEGFKKPNIQITVPCCANNRPDYWTECKINIKTDSIILFLWFETTLSHGYFEKNGVIVTEPLTMVKYVSKNSIKPGDLEKSITYQYYEN